MYHSVEVRWFFDEMRVNIYDYFSEKYKSASRTDWYIYPVDPRSGVKMREGKLETKHLIEELGFRTFGNASGNVEEWKKWSLPFESNDYPSEGELTHSGWIAVSKKRYLKMFEIKGDKIKEEKRSDTLLKNGCQFEITELEVQEQKWWTIGFEAFGKEEKLYSNLSCCVEHVLADKIYLDMFSTSHSYGYPEWLRRVVNIEEY